MSEFLFACSAAEGAERAVLGARREGVLVLSAELDAAEIEALIDQLAAARAALTPSAPMDVDARTRLRVLPDPRWIVPADDRYEGRVLALRHPGLGWLGFLFPRSEALQVARWLVHGFDKGKGADTR